MKPLRMINDHHWEKFAWCGTADPALFEPMTRTELVVAGFSKPKALYDPTRVARVRAALEVCAGCPVWKQCVVSRANQTGTYDPLVGVYGRQYVTLTEARRRKARALARARRLGIAWSRQRVRVIPRRRRTEVAA